MSIPADVQARHDKAHALVQLYESLIDCRGCGLCANQGRKAFDRSLPLYLPYHPIDAVFVGQAPAYCESRTGIPLVGASELLSSKCGRCSQLQPCYAYFCHKADTYKQDGGNPCPYPERGDCDTVTDQALIAKRIEVVPPAVSFKPGTQERDYRMAGALFAEMLGRSGWVRSSHAHYFEMKKKFVDPNAPERVPNCAVINTVQCWPYTVNATGSFDNRGPSDDERDACTVHVQKFIEIIQPKVIIALGSDAVKSLTGLKMPKMGDLRGNPVPYIYDTRVMVHAFYHPAYFLHMRSGANPRPPAEIEAAVAGEVQRLLALKQQYATNQ